MRTSGTPLSCPNRRCAKRIPLACTYWVGVVTCACVMIALLEGQARAGPLTAGTSCFKQEPNATLGLVDPVLKQTRTGDIAVLVAQFVRLTHPGRELLVISRKLHEHNRGDHILRVVIPDALQATDMTGRMQRRAADLAHPLSNCVGCGEKLIALFVKQ